MATDDLYVNADEIKMSHLRDLAQFNDDQLTNTYSPNNMDDTHIKHFGTECFPIIQISNSMHLKLSNFYSTNKSFTGHMFALNKSLSVEEFQ